MAGMFDYFTQKAQAMQPPVPEETEEEKRRRLIAITRGMGTLAPVVADPTVPTAIVDRPQLLPAPVQPISTYQATPDQVGTYTPDTETLLQRQQEATNWLQDTRNNPVVDNDKGKGFWHRFGNIGREFVIGAGNAYGSAQGDPEQRLMSAIGGGIAGGLGGAFKPTIDEERQRLYDIRRSQGREAELEGQLQREQAREFTNARIADIPVDNELKRLQILGVRQNKARTDFLRQKKFDPTNPLDVQLATEAGYDPSGLVAFDDRDPKAIKLGNDVLQLDRATGKWTVAGTRKDLVDWKLPDGRTVSIPADKAAYNATIQQMGAERISSNERIAGARLKMDEKQFRLAVAKFDQVKKEAEAARARGDEKAAREWLMKLTEMQHTISSDMDLSQEQLQQLEGLIGPLANLTPGINR